MTATAGGELRARLVTAGVDEAEATAAAEALTGLAERAAADAGTAFERPVVRALALLREAAPADFVRLRGAVKAAGVPLRELDRALRGEEPDGGGGRETIAVTLVRLAEATGIECWRTPDGEPHASFPSGDHREHHRLRTRAVREWLVGLLYEAEGRAAGGEALQAALGVFAARARAEGAVYPAPVRLHRDGGAVWLDLGAEDWAAVRVTGEGWEVVAAPPVRFVRPRGLLPLPRPVRGGNLRELRGLLNVAEEDWPLLGGWFVGALRGRGPYAILLLVGEHGAAKSTAVRLLVFLLDPRRAPLRAPPRDERDLAIGAQNGHVVALDNLSRLPDWLSDALCRVATGGGLATRELYSDGEEAIFDVVRPLVLTGITDVATRPDLLDRVVRVELPPIPDERRRREEDLLADFEAARPRLLGALLDAVACALRREDEVRLARLPRMADFARWVVAAEPALPWAPGAFLVRYEAARGWAMEEALDATPVGRPLLELLDAEGGWGAPAGDLLARLTGRVSAAVATARDWPRSPRGLGAALKRLAPALRVEGWEVDHRREDRRRVVVIARAAEGSREQPSQPSPSSPSAPRGPLGGDGRGDGPATTVSQPSPPEAAPAVARDGRDGRDGCLQTHSAHADGVWRSGPAGPCGGCGAAAVWYPSGGAAAWHRGCYTEVGAA